eukprot:142587_1
MRLIIEYVSLLCGLLMPNCRNGGLHAPLFIQYHLYATYAHFLLSDISNNACNNTLIFALLRISPSFAKREWIRRPIVQCSVLILLILFTCSLCSSSLIC